MKDEWFIRSKLDGNTFGPYTANLLETYIKDGRVGGNYVLSSDKTNWTDIESWSPPKMMGKYEILSELGRGGMGAVYLAYDSNLQRKCAIKVILSKDDKEAIKRFQLEAKAVAQIDHLNIIKIHDIQEQPHHFFVMDYVEGIPLNQYTINLPIKKKIELFAKICDAIVYAHKKNILHRDLKPANILVRKDGEPVIVDFGLAKNSKQENDLTKTGEIFGTLKYMAPEITRGKRGTHQVDVYALGVILYEMLTGRVPFDGENHMELLYQLTLKEPIPPSTLNTSIPKEGDLETICLKALEKLPKHRISSAKFLYKEIQSYIAGDSIRLKPPSSTQKLMKWLKDNAIWLTPLSFCLAAIFSYSWNSYQLQIKVQDNYSLTKNELLKSQEDVFNGYNGLREANKKSIDDYLRSKSDEQFFHLTVTQKLKDLWNKIEAEELLYKTYQELQKAKQSLSKNSNDEKTLLDKADKLLNNEKEWLRSKKYEKHKKENIRYYRRLDNHLRFSVLPNFPEKKSYEFENKPLSVCVSPINNYILQKNQQGSWLLWKRDKEKGFLKKTESTLIGLPKSIEKAKCIFSPDEKLIFIEEQGHLFFVEVATKRVLTSFQGYLTYISFDANNNYVCFLSYRNSKRLICIYSRKQNKIIQKIPSNYLFFTGFCKNTLVVVHKKTISIYNLRTRKLRHINLDLASIRSRVTLDKKNQQLFLLSRLALSSFDITKDTLRTFPYEFTGLETPFDKKSFMVIGQSQLALLRNSGEVVISYYNLFSANKSTQITNRRLLRRNNDSVYKIDFAPHYFLGIFKENSIDLVNTINGEKIITIDKAQNLSQTNKLAISNGQLTSLPNGLLVSLITKKGYEEYFFSFEKYSVNKDTQRIIQHLMGIYKTVAEIARGTLVAKDIVVYTSMIAFLVWKNKEFKGYSKILKSPYSFDLSHSGNYLAINYGLNEIQLYKTDEFDKPFNSDILGFEGRRYLKKMGSRNEITCSLFSKDDKNIFLAQPDLQLFSYNITSKKITNVSSFTTNKSLKLFDMIQLKDKHIILGFRDLNSKDGGFAIYSPRGKVTEYFKEGYRVCALTHREARFAVALENGDINIYENPKNPEKKIHIRVSGIPQKLSFSPDGKYIAVFTAGEIYVCDISIYDENKPNDIFRIYKGHFKNRIGTFSDDWKKAYFTNSSGDVLVFDQAFFTNKDAYLQRLEKINMFNTNELNEYRQEIENYLNK
ncbi:protein kinase [Candidatus Uabimicrobium sp. HlEnr_7]|uniref:serine/threonine-protein kinase n=1 Tax=Candidatus Uabimicrobium helgolandensis TaxID=3095367 RepID=UPI003557AC7F